MEEKKIHLSIDKIKKIIRSNIEKKQYNRALKNIYVCASILYGVNYTFVDDELENFLKEIANTVDNRFDINYKSKVIVFYDGFGLNDRGLAQIYLKAISKYAKILYITDQQHKNRIHDILEIVNGCGEVAYLFETKPYNKVLELCEIINKYVPEKLVFYSYPQDVVGVTCLNIYEKMLLRYNVNLTDHAFWLGAKAVDYNIEFRDYGASISKYHINIDENKLIKNPFYPNINKNAEFQGFPFEKGDKKVVFSGGSLYKTFGDNNKYYTMVEEILKQNSNFIFLYAGSGNSREIDRLKEKYGNRVFHTNERRDLYQVLCNCDLYLSTYPICGGLMFQYAAVAQKVPITLKYDNISDDFLFNQSELNVEFDDLNNLLNEVNKLLSDEQYMLQRCSQISSSVMTETEFEDNLKEILIDSSKGVDICFKENTKLGIKEEYIKNYTTKKFCDSLMSNLTIDLCIHFFKEVFVGMGIQFARKIKRIIRR